MLNNPVAENVFGTMGAVAWSCQLIPQAWLSYRTKDTRGLSTWMLVIWFLAGIFLGAYAISQNLNIPLIVQPQAFMFLCGICWAQCMHYRHGWSKLTSVLAWIGACAFAGGLEVGLYFAAKKSDRARQAWGVLSAVAISAGILPQYYEIWKFKAVIGISLVFLAVDLSGGVFSFLSLVFAAGPLDAFASASYLIIVFLEIGVFALVPILNPRHRRKLAEEARKADEEAAERAALERRTETDATAVEGGAHSVHRVNSKGEVETSLGWKCHAPSEERAALESQHQSRSRDEASSRTQ